MPRRSVVRSPSEPMRLVSNARLAMLVLIAAESMLFCGLIGAYLIFRLAAADWPPPNLPHLPIGITAINSLVLLVSVVPMTRALASVRQGRPDVAVALGWAATLGCLFLAIQGVEWARLVGHGLTLGGSTYGATFYVLIGCHGLHVATAVVWLLAVTWLARSGRFSPEGHAPLETCAMYWYFVCALWLVLFPLVYLV